jgi:hypothetical protein
MSEFQIGRIDDPTSRIWEIFFKKWICNKQTLSLTSMPPSWTSTSEEEEPKAIFIRPCGKAFKFFLHSSLTQGHRAQMKTLIKVGESIMSTLHQLT